MILCPAPAAKHVVELGRPVRIMRPGEAYGVGQVTVIAVRAYHPGGRASLEPDDEGGALGYIIRTRDQTLYYSGDTEYFDGLAAIGEMHRPDLLLLNINNHLDGHNAVLAVQALGAAPVVALHHSAYGGSNERSKARRPEELHRTLGPLFFVPIPGESFPLDAVTSDHAETIRAQRAAKTD